MQPENRTLNAQGAGQNPCEVLLAGNEGRLNINSIHCIASRVVMMVIACNCKMSFQQVSGVNSGSSVRHALQCESEASNFQTSHVSR